MRGWMQSAGEVTGSTYSGHCSYYNCSFSALDSYHIKWKTFLSSDILGSLNYYAQDFW